MHLTSKWPQSIPEVLYTKYCPGRNVQDGDRAITLYHEVILHGYTPTSEELHLHYDMSVLLLKG